MIIFTFPMKTNPIPWKPWFQTYVKKPGNGGSTSGKPTGVWPFEKQNTLPPERIIPPVKMGGIFYLLSWFWKSWIFQEFCSMAGKLPAPHCFPKRIYAEAGNCINGKTGIPLRAKDRIYVKKIQLRKPVEWWLRTGKAIVRDRDGLPDKELNPNAYCLYFPVNLPERSRPYFHHKNTLHSKIYIQLMMHKEKGSSSVPVAMIMKTSPDYER